MPKGPAKFVPKIYGFKIFGMRGSKYELKFDYQGKPVNEDDIREVLKKGVSDPSGQVMIGLGPTAGTSAPQHDNDMQNQSSNMSHQMSKDQIGQVQNPHKNLNPTTFKGKKKMASDDDEMNGD